MAEIETTSAELVESWFNEYVVEDQEICLLIGEAAREQCLKLWNCDIGDGKYALAIYTVIYSELLNELRTKRAKKSHYAISISDIVEVGYDDDTKDAETEKQGNLSPFIVNLGGHVKYEPPIDKETSARFVEWNSSNLTKNVETLNSIATASIKSLYDSFRVELSESAGIWPIFATIHDQLNGFLRVKLEEQQTNEICIDFASNFDAYCRKYEDGTIGIEYSPKPSQKLFTKGDGVATAVYES